MWRRAFITLVGGSVLALPIAAHAQQSGIPLIGYLGTGSPSAARELLTAFHLGLRETGYVGGQNIKIEYRWAEGQYERLPALAAELLQRQVTAIVTTVGSRAATNKIPIIFSARRGDGMADRDYCTTKDGRFELGWSRPCLQVPIC